jgi:hypothetical protein
MALRETHRLVASTRRDGEGRQGGRLAVRPVLVMSAGERYGRWTVLRTGLELNQVLAKCDCGTVRDVFASNLKFGTSRSCGCLRRETSPANIRHVRKLTPEQVREIRASSESQMEAGKRYGVTFQTIGHIRARKTWRHIP